MIRIYVHNINIFHCSTGFGNQFRRMFNELITLFQNHATLRGAD